MKNDLIEAIRGSPDRCMCYDEIRDRFLNPRTDSDLAIVLKDLVKNGILVQFRGFHCGRKQNIYQLAK